jgi:heat shock protein HtpX
VHRQHNGLKTAALIGFMSAVIVLAGSAFGRRGLVIALVVAVLANGVAYVASDRIALRSMRARPVSEAEQPTMFRIVRELSTAARQPMPTLYVSPTMAPNAFATGRDPRHAAVCCTEGILGLLDEHELRGVLGHELAHVYNRDILISSVAGALASVIMFLANFAWLLPRESDNDGPGLFEALAIMLLGPIGAALIQLAISRSREYQADVSGAAVTGDPLALASALRKLDAGVRAVPLRAEPELVTTGHLMIVNPFRAEGLARLFSTHPPMAERIARLEALAGYRR